MELKLTKEWFDKILADEGECISVGGLILKIKEEQDRQAAAKTAQPEIPLPKPGDVWGVVGKPETRRLVKQSYLRGEGVKGIEFFDIDGKGVALEHEWNAWVRETGAVDLLADREALAAMVKELESKDGYVVAAEWRATATRWRSEFETAEAEWRDKAEAAELRYADAFASESRMRDQRDEAVRLEKLASRVVDSVLAERDALRNAIITHHSQKADDRCIEDDDRLYAAANLPPCDRRVGSKEDMLKNCERFINSRCESGGWKSYEELEKDCEALRERAEAAERERDEVKASRDRLLAGLREVSFAYCVRIACGNKIGNKVADLIATEEEVGK